MSVTRDVTVGVIALLAIGVTVGYFVPHSGDKPETIAARQAIGTMEATCLVSAGPPAGCLKRANDALEALR